MSGVKLSGKSGNGLTKVTTDNAFITGDGSAENPISFNEDHLNSIDKYFITAIERNIINETRPIEFDKVEVVNGTIILEPHKRLYNISTSDPLTISVNTDQIDLQKFIRYTLKINLLDYTSLEFPANWYFNNFAFPNEVGEYIYEVFTTDSGATWHLDLIYKNTTQTGKVDVDGNPILGNITWYVDGEKADNSGDGRTWATAFKDPQHAIDVATIGDSIFVKGSLDGLIYTPTTERTAGDPRSKSFIIKSGVNMYGGFAGTETSVYQREMIGQAQKMILPNGTFDLVVETPKYKTIFSGDLNGDDVIDETLQGCKITEASMADNSYNVIYALVTGLTILNGFEITSGYNNSSSNGSGSAILGSNQSTLVSNCKIYNCFNNSTNLTKGTIYEANIHNSIVYNNTNNNGQGIACHSCNIQNCLIYGNYQKSPPYGGVLYSSKIINSAIFNNNIVSSEGGACVNSYCSNVVVFNNNVKGKTEALGAGFQSCTCINCSAFNNTTQMYGGGFNSGTAINCIAFNNLSNQGGSGFYKVKAINCIAFNNISSQYGGGFYLGEAINCVSIRNVAEVGAGTYNTILRNTVVYGNRISAGAVSNIYNDNNSVEEYVACEGELRPGIGNIELSPNNEGDANSPYFKFLSTKAGQVAETELSNPDISSELSALIDKGNNEINTTDFGAVFDIKLNPRRDKTSGLIDIGAMEFQK